MNYLTLSGESGVLIMVVMMLICLDPLLRLCVSVLRRLGIFLRLMKKR